VAHGSCGFPVKITAHAGVSTVIIAGLRRLSEMKFYLSAVMTIKNR
jgi:hypothetical protein